MHIRQLKLSLSLLIFFPGSVLAYALEGNIHPDQLRVEQMVDPSVVDVAAPRLSWINEAAPGLRGQSQSAYRIQVASSLDGLLSGLADLWDSGKVDSSDSYLVDYAGRKLSSGADCWWRVMTWDGKGNPSSWSAPAHWGMGILSADEWKAEWIGAPWQGDDPRIDLGSRLEITLPGQMFPSGQKKEVDSFPAPMLRKRFDIGKNVKKAKAFVTGLGYFELYVNGNRIGDDYLVPNITLYSKRDALKDAGLSIDDSFRNYRVLYLAYDVTDNLQRGNNVIGAILGDGFYDCTARWVASYGSPRLLCQLEIEYEDGTAETVVSDTSWKVHASPIVMNGVYDGERYDARLEIPEWSTPSCDDSDWEYATARKAPDGKLTAHTSPTDKVMEKIVPSSFTRQEDGSYRVEFPEEISGWIRLVDIEGKAGDQVDVKYICHDASGVHQYIFKGEGKESYAPRFTWYVFSGAVISGIDELESGQVIAEAVNTDVPVNAEFVTSNELINRINAIWQRTQKDNMHGSISSDCPHRERSPYTGDGQVACVTVFHNFDAASMYAKWIRDISDCQNVVDGYVPSGAPWQPGCGGGVPGGAAMNLIPWEYYIHYGDRRILEDNYFQMTEQVRYMLGWLTPDGTMLQNRGGVKPGGMTMFYNLGEWAAPGGGGMAAMFGGQGTGISNEFIHSFYLWRCADFTARAARVLGRDDDEAFYRKVAGDVSSAMHIKFWDPDKKSYIGDAANVFALAMGVPEERYQDVVDALVHEIHGNDDHLNTGIFGTQFFFETLAENGLNDLAYTVMNQRTSPGYGYWVENGSTTTWEGWTENGSHNHPMFGGGLSWFYRCLAGVRTDEDEPGFRHIVFKPAVAKGLECVHYAHDTAYGRVSSDIRYTSEAIEMEVTVPVGSRATVYVPGTRISLVKESGKVLGTDPLVKPAGECEGYVLVEVGQGTYHFTSVSK